MTVQEHDMQNHCFCEEMTRLHSSPLFQGASQLAVDMPSIITDNHLSEQGEEAGKGKDQSRTSTGPRTNLVVNRSLTHIQLNVEDIIRDKLI